MAERQDNTRVVRPIIIRKRRLTPQQLLAIKARKLQEYSNKNPAQVYDANKAKYHRNLQNFYNTNVFGYGISGTPTNYDTRTSKGQTAIRNNFNYARNNATDFVLQFAPVGITQTGVKLARAGQKAYSALTRGLFTKVSPKGSLGSMSTYLSKQIGSGGEAVVIDNSPINVGKMTSIPVEEMVLRNSVPNAVPSKYIGYVKSGSNKLPTYIQDKVKIITEEAFPKYIDKFDKSMQKFGFKRVNDPNVYGAAYTDGKIVIDDIAPGNLGLTSGNPLLDMILPDFLKKPKIIDMVYQTVPEWRAMGYKLKHGGKLE